jgi:hypothetical protein
MKQAPQIRLQASPVRAARSVRGGDEGAVLLVVMMVLITLMGLGMTALWLTNGNLQMSANVNLRSNALYVAEAGIERARQILNDPVPPDVPTILAGTNPGNDRVPTMVDPVTGLPNGIGAVMVDQGGLPLLNVAYPPATFGRSVGTATAPTATTMGTYTVWIRNDNSDLRRGFFGSDTNNTVLVRSQGTSADGRTNVVLEVVMGPTPDIIPTGTTNTTVPPELCNSGKNACDENNSTLSGIVVN